MEQLSLFEDNVIKEIEVDLEPPKRAKIGDIWQLGKSRLMCGDSTNKNNVDKLLNGAKIDLVFTDHPYNVAFNERNGKFDVIKNDDLAGDDFDEFISSFCEMIKFVDPENYCVWRNWKFYATLQTKSCIVWAKNVCGSTLIACEQLNRSCYMMELDPHYIDIILYRWEKLTNRKAILL